MTRHSAGNVERIRCCKVYEEEKEGVVGVGGGDELVDIVVLRGRDDCFVLSEVFVLWREDVRQSGRRRSGGKNECKRGEEGRNGVTMSSEGNDSRCGMRKKAKYCE